MDKLAQLFNEQIACIFEETRMLPNYGQLNPTFIARPRQQDTFSKIENILKSLNGDFEVESFKSSGNAHAIKFNDETRIVIIYAKDQDDFEWLYRYHSYSNSMILGRILKNAGFKLSEDGLEYQQLNLNENHRSVVGSIVITKNFGKILQVLKLDTESFERGFKNTNEIFEFLLQCPYLNPQKFINKEKEQRSILMQKFEEYLLLNNIKETNSETLTFENVKQFFSEIPFEKLIEDLMSKAITKKQINDAFNGRVILDSIPDFDPKKIGASIGCFKYNFDSIKTYHEFLVGNSREEIISKFKEVIDYE